MVIDSINQNIKNFIFFKDSKTGYCFPMVTPEGTKHILKYNGSPLTGLLNQQSIDVSLTAYPNPTCGSLTINMESDNYDNYWLLVNDISVNLIYKKEFHHAKDISEILNTSTYAKGTYIITLSNSKGTKCTKFIAN